MAARKGNHTLLLVQSGSTMSTRTFYDFETEGEAFDGVVRLYENRLKELNPDLTTITYDIANLFAYLDTLPDLSMLIFNPTKVAYEPFGKEWIKAQTFAHLKAAASR